MNDRPVVWLVPVKFLEDWWVLLRCWVDGCCVRDGVSGFSTVETTALGLVHSQGFAMGKRIGVHFVIPSVRARLRNGEVDKSGLVGDGIGTGQGARLGLGERASGRMEWRWENATVDEGPNPMYDIDRYQTHHRQDPSTYSSDPSQISTKCFKRGETGRHRLSAAETRARQSLAVACLRLRRCPFINQQPVMAWPIRPGDQGIDGLTSVWTLGNQGETDIKADDGSQLHWMLDGEKGFLQTALHAALRRSLV